MGASDEARAFAFSIAVQAERTRQDAKWGATADHHPTKWITILLEEVGECARAVLERKPAELARELVQVAAVCQRIYELNTQLALTEPEPPPQPSSDDDEVTF